jgi:hypothetical protein
VADTAFPAQTSLATGGRSFTKTAPFWIGILVLNGTAIAVAVGSFIYCRYRRKKMGKQLTSFRHFVHHQHTLDVQKTTFSGSAKGSAGGNNSNRISSFNSISSSESSKERKVSSDFFPNAAVLVLLACESLRMLPM